MNMLPKLSEANSQIEDVIQNLKSLSKSLNGEKLNTILMNIEKLQAIENEIDLSIKFTYFGQKCGGQAKNAKKTLAVRENGKKGGRPSKKSISMINTLCPESEYLVVFNDNSSKIIKGNLLKVRETFPISRYKWEDIPENLFQEYLNS